MSSLQIKKLRLRNITLLAQPHIALKNWSQAFTSQICDKDSREIYSAQLGHAVHCELQVRKDGPKSESGSTKGGKR
jgi:hypothetical protein